MKTREDMVLKKIFFVVALLVSSAVLAENAQVNCSTSPETNGIVCQEEGLICTTIIDNTVLCNDLSVKCMSSQETNALECYRKHENINSNYERVIEIFRGLQ